MGQGFSDLFYPDNPNRRARVDDMQHDMEALKEEFEALVAEFKKNMELIRPELDKLMAAAGFVSGNVPEGKLQDAVDQLNHLNGIIESIDKTDLISGILLDLSIMGSVIAGVGLLITVCLTSMTAAFASGVGAVIGLALLAITVVAAAITGAIEREKLRNAINEVYCNRIAVKLSVERQRAFNDWSANVLRRLEQVKTQLNMSQAKRDATAVVAGLTEIHTALKTAYDEWTAEIAAEFWYSMDLERGSWRNEDPNMEECIQLVKDAENTTITINNDVLRSAPKKKPPPPPRSYSDPPEPTVTNVKLSPPKGTITIPGVNLKQKGLNVILREQTNKTLAMVVLKHGGEFLSVRDGVLGKWDDPTGAERQLLVKVVKVNPDSMEVRLRLKANNKFISHVDGKETDDKTLGIWIAKSMKAA